MIKKLLFLYCALVTITTVQGKEDPRYPVFTIPEDMKTGMYAVIRDQEVRLEIKSINSSSYYYRIAITILNPNAKSYAKEIVGYDKLTVLKYLRGTAYDAMGSVIKKLKQSDIYDQSAFDGFSLYSDNRLKRGDLSQGTYPYTVEFEYEIEEKKLYDLPDFFLYHDDEVSIEKSSFSILYPAALKPRYKLFKMQEPTVSQRDGKEVMQWSFKNIKPEKFEKLSPDFRLVVPNVAIAPNQFEYDGYAGNMSSWEDYGKWNALLNQGRDNLSEKTKQEVRTLTSGLKTNEEKTKKLYEYLQGKTRYVSIQLGIGGLQPFPASMVEETGYGDCKALSNFMVALLKEAGIKGYYTTVSAGADDYFIDADFPSHQSNHVIVSVPNGADTLWLECTSQSSPFNYQGRFTGDRKALMITEDGGKLVNTHRYSADQNAQTRIADVYLDLNGDATATVKTTYAGTRYEKAGLSFILDNKYDEQKKWVQENTEIPSFDIQSFTMTNHKAALPSAVVTLNLGLKRYAVVNGKRVFLTANLMNRSTYIPEKTEQRKTNIVLRGNAADLDTIRYHIPESIYPEFLPEPVTIKSKFGEYESQYKLDQGNLIYIRKMKVTRGEYPPEAYKELIDFYKAVSKADNTKVVFLSKT